MFNISWPLFGKKRKEVERRARLAREWEARAFAMDREVMRLRQYIDEEMQRHFTAYNGGVLRQMQQLWELRLPTPWVPVGIKDADAPVPDNIQFNTVTYVREHRMVPIREAGRI